MIMAQFVKFPDLPTVPKELWPDLNIINAGADPLWHNKPRCATKGDVVIAQDRYARFDISQELRAWADKNIRNDYVNIGLSVMWDGGINLPHTDFTRDITLTYVFKAGGSDVRTVFYKFKQGELYQGNGCTPTDLNELEELESVVLDEHCWAMLESTVLHSVEGKTQPRISLQLGFSKDNEWAREILGPVITH
jgi:hypothetical protein